MNQSSVFWGTVYAKRNLTAMAAENDNLHGNGKYQSIPAVSWWQVGNDVSYCLLFTALKSQKILNLKVK